MSDSNIAVTSKFRWMSPDPAAVLQPTSIRCGRSRINVPEMSVSHFVRLRKPKLRRQITRTETEVVISNRDYCAFAVPQGYLMHV